jgi:hypothetical protein
LSELASSRYPPDLSLLSNKDYRLEPLTSTVSYKAIEDAQDEENMEVPFHFKNVWKLLEAWLE